MAIGRSNCESRHVDSNQVLLLGTLSSWIWNGKGTDRLIWQVVVACHVRLFSIGPQGRDIISQTKTIELVVLEGSISLWDQPIKVITFTTKIYQNLQRHTSVG
jgi:hypothetical protein